MRNKLPRLVFLSFIVWVVDVGISIIPVQAQSGNCTSETPFFSVDLTGQPGGSFTTPTMNRNGNCCGSATNTNCVEFEVFLDSRASGLAFDITDGPVPSGSMFYQIDCGSPISVGDSTCVDGTGPHILTICMPGNAQNQFTVYSVIAFEEVADISVTGGCSGTLSAPLAFDPATVTYDDITGNGSYNSYLSCLVGCASTTVTPDANAPPFVDYLICGSSNNSNCTAVPFCDTVRVNFFPEIQVSVDPSPALICQNGTTTLQGMVSGGSGGPYTYIWFDGPDGTGNIVGSNDSYLASASGTYSFEVRNENYPDCEPFIANVDVNDNFAINAGADQTVCPGATVQLSGSVQGATGGIWSGGSGTFSPDNQTLNPVYTPTQTEIDAGTLTLTLTSTGNGNCTPGTDQVIISFYETMTVTLDGPPTLCNNNTTTIQANVSGGSGNYSYLWDTGETTSSVTKPAGTYGITVTDITRGCQSTANITITQLSGPSGVNMTPGASTCGNANGSITVNSVNGGTSPYSYSLDDITYQSGATFNDLLAGTYSVFIQDANGCSVGFSITVSNIAGPSGFQASTSSATCGNPDGILNINAITGGSAPYEYSIDGTNYQSGSSFTNLLAGNYDVSIRDNNNCIHSEVVTIANVGGPDGASISTTTASCANNDGSITVNSVSNGVSPYQYSMDGNTYQNGASFTGLAAANYTVYIQDSNGCVYTQNQTVLSEAPNAVNATASSATCSLANGTITVQNVSGGFTPYTYSLDGVQFQSSTSFSALLPGAYTLIAMDNKGCTVSTNLQVTDIPGPGSLQHQSQSSTCGASNGSLSVTQVTGGTTPYQYTIDGVNFQSSPDFNNLSSGVYTLTVRDANNCEYATSANVNDVNGPTGITISSNPTTCGNNNGLIAVDAVNGGVSPYTYAVDGGSFQSSNTFNNILAGSHTVSARDANGCVVNANTNVGDIAGPSGFTFNMSQATCGGNDGSIEVTAVIQGTAPFLYALENGNFQSGSSFSGLSAGNYLITVRDDNGCEFSNTINVTNNGGPSAITYSTTQANCGQSDGSITVNSVTGGDTPYTYSLDATSFQSSNLFSGLAFGDYEVTVQDNKGCLFTEAVFVPSVGPETLELEANNTICGLDNGSIIIAAVTGGTIPYSYSLDGVSFTGSNTFNDLAIGDYTVYVQDDNGCILTEDVTLIDTPGPRDMQFSLMDATCGQDNGRFIADAVTGGTGPYQFSVDAAAFQSSVTITGIAPGNHTATVRDANGCEYSVTFNINDIAGPSEVTATTTASDCNQSNGTIEATGVTGGTPSFNYSIDGSNFQSNSLFTGIPQGQYTLTARDANGCEIITVVEVLNNDGPQSISTSVVNETCGNNDGSISVMAVNGGATPYLYAIDNNNFQNNGDFTGLVAGTYSIFVKDANDCEYQEQVVVGSNGPAAVNYRTSPASCNVRDGSLTIDQVTGGSGPFSYSLDGVNFQSSNVFTDLASGIYSLTIVDTNACNYVEEVEVGGQGPQASLTELKDISCFGNDDGSIVVDANSPNTPVSFSIDDGSTFQGSGEFTDLSAGFYTVLIMDNNGCSTTINDLEIMEPEIFQAQASIFQMPDPGISNGIAYVEGLKGGIPPYTITLNGQDMGQDTLFQNLSPDVHTIMVEDQNQCQVSFEVDLESEMPLIEIPNGFTPNADGMNDTWELADLSLLYPEAEVQVFNRWGQLIFYSKGYANPWNGKRQGQDLPTATYYYVIKVSADIQPLQGTVTIIR